MMSHRSKREMIEAIRPRYLKANKTEKEKRITAPPIITIRTSPPIKKKRGWMPLPDFSTAGIRAAIGTTAGDGSCEAAKTGDAF